MQRYTRRALCASGAALLGSLAGCSALPGGPSDTDDLTLERLDSTAVYVGDDVDLSMPEEVETVGATNNADVLVLPGDTDVGAEQAVDWLAAERVVALVGEDAEPTWLSWVRSDEFTETFDNEGYGDSEPDPYLHVAAAIGTLVETYGHTWQDGPRDRDVLRALDETLVEIENETPRE